MVLILTARRKQKKKKKKMLSKWKSLNTRKEEGKVSLERS